MNWRDRLEVARVLAWPVAVCVVALFVGISATEIVQTLEGCKP